MGSFMNLKKFVLDFKQISTEDDAKLMTRKTCANIQGSLVSIKLKTILSRKVRKG